MAWVVFLLPTLALLHLAQGTTTGGTCDSEQIVSSTSWGCPGGPEQSNSSRCGIFPASNILSLDDDEWDGNDGSLANYWLAEHGQTGEEQGFIMYLGCRKTVTGVSLKNTHNGRDHAYEYKFSTKKFRILGSANNSGPWQELLVANLEDTRRQDPEPLQQLMFDNSAVVSFVKFELLEFYGLGGGLQYFALVEGASTEESTETLNTTDTTSSPSGLGETATIAIAVACSLLLLALLICLVLVCCRRKRD